ncbi:replication stress response regulator SDE2 isoform X2 [Notolabrus celidotus]|uniref:replication stress response regulator SDE2 isoform X2 n=1 Tax=Notolabrus celidotus TaxID=1203425 RepID=UPI00148F823C|nr:replication stress response regulator SDE2 isoform X2 [Notolabrus celidotus]
MEVFVSSQSSRFSVAEFPAGSAVRDLLRSFTRTQGVSSSEDFYVVRDGRLSHLEDPLQPGAVYHLEPRLCGGKGGFGSMLRALGAQIEKTTNREACRDLSGRRLRDVNHEKEMAEWLKKQAEREAEKEQRRLDRLQRKLAEPKHHFTDPEYQQQCHDLSERLEDSVIKGLQASSSGQVKADDASAAKRPSSGQSEEPQKKKKKKKETTTAEAACFWMGVDEMPSSEGEDDEEEEEDEESPSTSSSGWRAVTVKTHREAEPEQNSSSSDCSSSSSDQIPRPPETSRPTESSRPSETPKPSETSRPTEAPRPTETPKPSETSRPTEAPRPSETPRPTETPKPSETSRPTEAPRPSEDQRALETSKEQTLKPSEDQGPAGPGKPSEESSSSSQQDQRAVSQVDPSPVDLSSVSSASELEALGLDVLKGALMSRGLKCGGTVTERAARLFSVRGLTPDQINPALLAKPSKTKRK